MAKIDEIFNMCHYSGLSLSHPHAQAQACVFTLKVLAELRRRYWQAMADSDAIAQIFDKHLKHLDDVEKKIRGQCNFCFVNLCFHISK